MNRKKREGLILDAAIRVFARQGYPTTSVSEIIEEASVARGTFYLYFKSKKDIFNTLIDRFFVELAQNVAKINALNAPRGADLSGVFRQLASDFITTITKNRLLTKIMLVDSRGLEGEFDAKISQFYDQLSRIIQHNLDLNIKAGLFRNCDTGVVARCMIGSVKEMVASWVMQESMEIESVIQGLIDYLLNGLNPIVYAATEKAVASEEAKSLPRLGLNFH
ncbi:MAG: TetR/AcrR family transcriptional regulator [Deltaproteobacteria bacterium]|nr:TetR/AcrR family transcriptional regulator [Deltaproteobacteria bacterium]